MFDVSEDEEYEDDDYDFYTLDEFSEDVRNMHNNIFLKAHFRKQFAPTLLALRF